MAVCVYIIIMTQNLTSCKIAAHATSRVGKFHRYDQETERFVMTRWYYVCTRVLRVLYLTPKSPRLTPRTTNLELYWA